MKRIKNLKKQLVGINENEKFCIVIEVTKIKEKRLKDLNLDQLAINEAILPKMIGPTTRFNSRGKEISLKKLPKEKRYVGSREWTREEWIGGGRTQTVTTTVDSYRWCYQRQLVPPPSAELIKIRSKNETYFSSQDLTNNASAEDLILHVINMFLELFGEFEILKDGESVRTKTVKVNWRFLPPGEKIWQRILQHIQENNKKGPTITNVITARQVFMENLNPKMTYIGIGGFSDYIAYVFENFTLLESIAVGNAIYVFKENWENLSQYTKAQLINGNLATRIIHSEGWQLSVKALFRK